jgi:hypothetical protein
MSATRTDPAPAPPGSAAVSPRVGGGADRIVVTLVAAGAVLLALIMRAHHLQGVPGFLLGSAAGLVLFGLGGDAIAYVLLPASWRAVRPVLALALGAAAGALLLTGFGVLGVPLHVSLWVSLAIAAAASATVRRRRFVLGSARGPAPEGWRAQRRTWLAVLGLVWLVAIIPLARTGADTVWGENPDASQVVGIAVLFQHVAPTATDVALPLDVVPPEWRFRYPIFYPLAAASSLAHADPIRVFEPLVALLAVITAFGFGWLAVEGFGAPPRAGPVVAAVIGFSWTLQHLAWHPYYNQLWGLAMLPYALTFGWRALRDGDGASATLCAFALVMLWLAYPLALPYPLLILGALALAHRRRPRLPSLRGARRWLLVPLALLVLAPAVAGAVVKLAQGVSQLLSSSSALWGGDVTRFLPVGLFVGTGGGLLPALVVLAVAVLGLRALPRRPAIVVGTVLGGLCLLDLRFRLVSSGTYMDFKHLSFVGTLVLTLAAAAVARMLLAGDRRLLAVGGVLLAAWSAAALVQDRADGFLLPQQVTAQMFQVRRWMARLPAGASVRVDIPPSGVQLWAVYMLGSHPVCSLEPVLHSTYAHAIYGGRADYALALRYDPAYGPTSHVPQPPQWAAGGTPVFENSQFVLRRIDWPPGAVVAPRCSRRLVTS